MRTNESKEDAPIFLLVLAGGSGTRFWPKSTEKLPKQLLPLAPGGKTFLTATLSRFQGWIPEERQWILTTRKLENATREEVGHKRKILAEPEARNTAPCLYWAAQEAYRANPESILVVMSSDHWIGDVNSFITTVKKATEWALAHADLITLGIKPTRPETGYGYLKQGLSLGEKSGGFKVDAFVEKPNLTRAKEFFSDPHYLWNGGMFVWKSKTLLDAFQALDPAYDRAWKNANEDVFSAYPTFPAQSIDYAILEKSKSVVTFPLDCGWDDVGSWSALENLAPLFGWQDSAGTRVSGDVTSLESSGNIIDVPGKVVALLGVKDLVIVENRGVLLVLPKDRAQEMKRLLEKVKTSRPDLA